MVFALAGNQNSGKTTLFNQLTGSNQHVGNFPGVTVDKKGRDHPRPTTPASTTAAPRSWGHPRHKRAGHPAQGAGHRRRPAGHLLAEPLHLGGDRHARLPHQGKAGRHHQHRRRHEHRAQPVPDDAAHRSGHPDGGGAEHDGRDARQRQHRGRQPPRGGAGRARGADLGGQKRGHRRADRARAARGRAQRSAPAGRTSAPAPCTAACTASPT